jgi:hypothetical protein
MGGNPEKPLTFADTKFDKNYVIVSNLVPLNCPDGSRSIHKFKVAKRMDPSLDPMRPWSMCPCQYYKGMWNKPNMGDFWVEGQYTFYLTAHEY